MGKFLPTAPKIGRGGEGEGEDTQRTLFSPQMPGRIRVGGKGGGRTEKIRKKRPAREGGKVEKKRGRGEEGK
eukprot:1338133-Amorphochlora_amoeboformis.AAC.1